MARTTALRRVETTCQQQQAWAVGAMIATLHSSMATQPQSQEHLAVRAALARRHSGERLRVGGGEIGDDVVATRAADKLKFTLGMDFKAAKVRVTEYIRRDIGTIAVRGIASMLLLRRRYAATHQASVAGHSAESGGTSDATSVIASSAQLSA